ncbi:proteinase IV [Agrobacterium tumefaciens str. Cherry 2E-2-2]|uniref:Proteinase IV n=2 Tax=Agrobacterium TaxID=357 RepID=A0A1S7TPJ7_9HYPH|nr:MULTISPECIES: signal peptide peptidase SppA [Agrobacterium]EMS99272.1 proteinase IV [Agrobacterium tumefaciens str. Cherry 2E-2-2]UXT42428.1 signal peptide peptidase SppA [Agrobacterium tumefaciens]MCZ7908225.1 signal peptide peptidase SppA [Agrobacterium leguminum]MCZ7932319.1 signal peptide peptidase SppA [Agrobacterium leguminum]WFS67232.1 signal peptide peptidase SppA [Agrobacterium leguminum]
MDNMAIADRRRLRRKLTFWRIAAVLLLVAGAFGLYRFLWDGPQQSAKPHIARVEVSGLITDNTELLERLDKIAKSENVKGLIVSISSPGGTTYGGERIFKAIRGVAEKKPVVSDVRTLAASAGYMIASAGDVIVAGETSITGSIGVIFQYPQLGQLMEKLGVSLQEIKSSPMKAEPSPFHEAPEEAKTMIRAMVMDSYGWFVDLVADRRKLPREDVLKLADGSIFTGRQALANKLVDTLGGEKEIRSYFETRGVAKDLPIVEWRAPSSRSPFALFSVAQIAKFLGYDDLIPFAGPGQLGTDKLFLDGLVSVWQVEPR